MHHTRTLEKVNRVLEEIQRAGLSSPPWNQYKPVQSWEEFRCLSILKRRDIEKTPLDSRVNTRLQLLLKLVQGQKDQYLVGRALSDISAEPLALESERPLILFDEMEEGLQWSLWCYEHNILPLIGERNEKLTALAAARYCIDAIVCDSNSLLEYLHDLEAYHSLDSVKTIAVLDRSGTLRLPEHIDSLITRYLNLREVGLVGRYDEETRSFITTERTLAEEIDGKLVVTQLQSLPTPIVRYQTTLEIETSERDVESDFVSSFTLTNA